MNRADSLLSRWLNHRKVLHELLEAIGNEHTHYKPWRKPFPRLPGDPHRHILLHVR